MALKPCKECGGPVSDKAESCPKCGAKQPKKTSKLVLLFAGAILLFIFVQIFSDNNSTSAPTNTTKSSNQENKAGVMLFYIQNKIKQSAKDPDSVQFRNEKINNDTDVGAVACGQYNAKNSFGAYAGYKGFVAVEKTQKAYFEDGPNQNEFPKYWNKYCVG
ncbi:zinc ribbon domain-containing protein [Acinetobacter sp.]|uniref:zinc ribbon domain-containing protein n=1 Tax=Acinetobacter sp. TaxID=472 RepID=UPI00388D3FA8